MMDLTRNSLLDKPEELNVLVIGVGATGSNFVEELVKLGITNINIVDPGEVKPHNLTNQAYTKTLVGLNKAEALNYMMTARYGVPLNVLPVGFSMQELGMLDVVFNCVDIPDVRTQYRKDLSREVKAIYIETAFDVLTSDVFITTTDSQDIHNIENMVGRQEDYGSEGRSEVTTACGAKMSVSASITQLIGTTIWKMVGLLTNNKVGEFDLGIDTRMGKYTISANCTSFYSKFPENMDFEVDFEMFEEGE